MKVTLRYELRQISLLCLCTDRNRHIRVIMGGGRSKFFMNNQTDPEYDNIMGERLDENLFEASKI